MAEYIEREALRERFEKRLDWLRRDIHDEYSGALYDGCETDMGLIAEIPAADIAPVARCKDCEYSYEDLCGLCCSHGPCVDCNVPEDYFCAYGKRRTENNGDQTNM